MTKSNFISTGEARRRLELKSTERVRQLVEQRELEAARVLDRVAIDEDSVERLAGRRASRRVDRAHVAGARASRTADRRFAGSKRPPRSRLVENPQPIEPDRELEAMRAATRPRRARSRGART